MEGWSQRRRGLFAGGVMLLASGATALGTARHPFLAVAVIAVMLAIVGVVLRPQRRRPR